VASWVGFGAAANTLGDTEGRKRDGILRTFTRHMQDPKLWVASAAAVPAMGAYGKIHNKALTHFEGKGGKIGKVAGFFKNNKIGQTIDPTGSSIIGAMGYGAIGMPTPFNAVMGVGDPDSKIWSGLKGKFWDRNKKYKTPVEEDSF
jgi:hypothetical protein